MQVTIQRNGCSVTGLHVGATNVRRYFTRRVSTIELQLDHLQIECWLKPEFWQGDGEIHDPRLVAWLELKSSRGLPSRGPLLLSMIPCGKNCFRLCEMCANESRKARHAPATAA